MAVATRRKVAAAAQRGAAIVTALLVVTLAATVVAGLFVRENVTVRSVENRLALSQTRWIERAALDWAKVILRADARTGNVDHFGEPWAVPVADTRLDETVTAGAKLGDKARAAMLAGQILDAQARFNVNALAEGGLPSEPHLQAYRRLLAIVGLPESLADATAARVARSLPRTVDGVTTPASELPLVRLGDLLGVPGYDRAAIDALAAFAVALPRPTAVNVNTAPAEVLAAVVPGQDLTSARRFVARRERTFYQDLGQAGPQFDGQPTLSPKLLSVGSSYFVVRGMVRFDRVESSSETLLERSQERVEIIWQQRY
jgi:general secretion pathway protein K